jgi:hypothetical protein
MHFIVHHLPSKDVEAYSGATPPTPTTSLTFYAYSDACWGFQIGNAVSDGTILHLF